MWRSAPTRERTQQFDAEAMHKVAKRPLIDDARGTLTENRCRAQRIDQESMHDTGAWTPNSKVRTRERERPDGTTGPRDQASTPNGATGPPILDPGTTKISQAGNEARGQTGARRDHGTTGPSQHTERGHRATDSGSWDHQSKPGWERGTGPDGTTGPRDHAGTPNGATGPPILDLGPPT